MYNQAWKYYQEMDEKEAKLLEQKTDELTMSCLYIKNCEYPDMLKTLSTQFGLGNNNFLQELEQCCMQHS